MIEKNYFFQLLKDVLYKHHRYSREYFRKKSLKISINVFTLYSE